MAFIETPRFPVEISYGSGNDIEFLTEVSAPISGIEVRASQWSQPRNNLEASFDLMSHAKYEEVKRLFYATRGRLHGFRAKDDGDYKSCDLADTIAATDQTIGAGDGVTAAFQLVKDYVAGQTFQRIIEKPVSGTVLISIDDVAVTGGWSVDTTTGLITFNDETTTVTNAVDNGDGTTRITTTPNSNLSTGESAYLTTFTGDWAVLNDTRYVSNFVDVHQFDIAVDSSLFTAYSSNGGQTDTIPQTGETLKAGFEFDVKVRFAEDQFPSTWRSFEQLQMNIPLMGLK